MAHAPRPSRQFEQPLLPDDLFESEADTFLPEGDESPSEAPSRRPNVVVVAKNEDWESFFPPEEPESVVTPADSQEPESMFAYQPGPPMSEPASTGARPEHAQYLTLRAAPRWQKAAVAAVVVVAVLASTALLGRRVMNRQVVPATEPQLVSSRSTSPSVLPMEPDTDLFPQSVVKQRVVNRSPIRAVDDNRRTSPRIPPDTRRAPYRGAGQPSGVATAIFTPTPPAVAQSAPVRESASAVAGLSPGNAAPPVAVSPARSNVPPAAAPPPAAATADSSAALPASAPAVSAPAAAPTSDTAAIESLLARYRAAFSAFDVYAVESFWPTVNAKALGNAFNQLEEQQFDFDECRIDVKGPQANAVCAGTARFVPTIGSRKPRVESRRWTFHLVRVGGGWRMDRVESR
jgi:hypothetical protein